jgi:hypothetical protein
VSYGRLNIWLREVDCTPRNVWKVELMIKTCGGAYLVDFNPDVMEKLKQAFPPPEFDVYLDSAKDKVLGVDETTIAIKQMDYVPKMKHVELELPPGCYIVRAWVCGWNMWSDRAMVIVDCGETACVNLIIPRAKDCIKDVIPPLAVVAQELKLPPAKMNAAFEILMKAGGLEKGAFVKAMAGLAREFKGTKDKEELKYAKAFDFLARQVRTIRM